MTSPLYSHRGLLVSTSESEKSPAPSPTMEGEVEVGGNACCAMVVLAHAWWVHSVLKKLFEALKWGASFLEVMEVSE